MAVSVLLKETTKLPHDNERLDYTMSRVHLAMCEYQAHNFSGDKYVIAYIDVNPTTMWSRDNNCVVSLSTLTIEREVAVCNFRQTLKKAVWIFSGYFTFLCNT